MFKWFKSTTLDPLSVSMAGVKLGDRVLVVGASDAPMIAALAAKAGLTGRTVAADESEAVAREAERVALGEGALIETATAPLASLPFDDNAFDLVVLRDVISGRDADARDAVLTEAQRVLRPGGRCMLIDSTGTRGGIAALFGGKDRAGALSGTDAVAAFTACGFVAARTLAEREGLLFVEAVKRNA